MSRERTLRASPPVGSAARRLPVCRIRRRVQSLLLTPIFLTTAPKWCRRNSTVGIAPGAHSAGRLHQSDMSRALRRSPDGEIRRGASSDRQAMMSGQADRRITQDPRASSGLRSVCPAMTKSVVQSFRHHQSLQIPCRRLLFAGKCRDTRSQKAQLFQYARVATESRSRFNKASLPVLALHRGRISGRTGTHH